MKMLTGSAVLVAGMLALSACGGSHRTVSSSSLILGGRVRCTATVSKSVQAGDALGLTFAVRNVSRRTVKVPLGLWMVVRAADGTTYDTREPLREPLSLPFVAPTGIPAGATKKVHGPGIPVRWKGPLRVTPGCERSALPVLHVDVKAPGPPPDERTAVADAVAASGHLLDHCRPERAGVPVQGQIYLPSGGVPPMPATCSVSIQNKGGFLVAQVLIASPPGTGYVHVRQPYEQLSVHHARSYETSTWAFVVTKHGTIPVAAAEADATKWRRGRRETFWSLNGSHWQKAGDGVCGGSGRMGAGPNPMIDFISVCAPDR